MPISLKRVFDKPARSDGARVLVDRLWPRGVSKASAQLTVWLRELAPSNELRVWYHSHPAQWLVFRKKYLHELRAPEAAAALEQLYQIAASHPNVTLLYASRNLEQNNATVLKELMEGSRKPPSTSGALKAAALKRGRAKAPR
jgi:uncharacterized protein YeaO (DUF488 family)